MASKSKADEFPPSYEDSTNSSTSHMLSGPDIVTKVEFSRQEVVRAAVENHFLPVLRKQASLGLAKSTAVLEPYQPSEASVNDEKSFDDPSSKEKAQIVSHEGENMAIVQLEGESNSIEFWSQPSAVEELRRQLHDILCASTVFEGVEFKPQKAASQPEASKESKSWGKRLVKEFVLPRDEIALAHPPKNSQGVQLSVKREDIVRRTENAFGLFENFTKPGIVVRVEVIC